MRRSVLALLAVKRLPADENSAIIGHWTSMPATPIFRCWVSLFRECSSEIVQMLRVLVAACCSVSRADQGFCVPFHRLFSLLPLSLPCSCNALSQLEGLGERRKLPQWGTGRSPSRKRIWCTPAVRKPLVAIILNIRSTMFYSATINI